MVPELPRLALVTGANRGIGLAVARELAVRGVSVIAACRRAETCEETLRALHDAGDVATCVLDVSSTESVQAARARIEHDHGPVDILVNNAGIAPDQWVSVLETDEQAFRDSLEVNLLGAQRCCQAFLPGMLERGYGRVVNVSTELASISTMEMGSTVAYRSAKAGLNALTRLTALELGLDSPVKVNAACPGWVRTELGGPGALYSVEEGADTIVWLALLEDDGPSGGNFRQREAWPW